MRRFILSVIFIFMHAFSFVSSAQYFMHDEGHIFVDAEVKKRTIGIEIEFSGIDDKQTIKLLKSHFGAREISLPDLLPGERVFDTQIGQIRLKIEGQAWRYENKDPVKFREQLEKDKIFAPKEIVFSPLSYDQVTGPVQKFFDELKQSGAVGTNDQQAVSLQVNVGMGALNTSSQNVKDLLSLMRVYFNPEHREQADQLLRIPKVRKEYVQSYSAGFLRKLSDPNYKPSPKKLFNDYMYRQTYELLGHKDAWSAPLHKVKQVVLAAGESPALIRVAKLNPLRISSLLAEAFPNDPLSELLIREKWLKPIALVEFREFNNDFDVVSATNRSLGVIRASQLLGDYDHDEVVSNITGVSTTDLGRLRKELTLGKRKIVRYGLYDPELSPFDDEVYAWYAEMSPRTIQIQLSSDKIGTKPLILPKDVIVWQRRHIHRDSIKSNIMPGMENHLIQQVMENKILEAELLAEYAPGSMPQFVALRSFHLQPNPDPITVWQKLNQVFPQGWVLKSAFDYASEKIIVTNSIQIEQVMRDYENGFEEYKKEMEAEFAGDDPEYFIYWLKQHPGYLGWKIKQILSNVDLAFAQEKVKIKNELRIEVLGGRVLGYGSTVDRYAYQDELDGKTARPKLSSRLMRDAERFAQSVIDRLPPELRIVPFGLDVALLEDGTWTVIETNPGGNSGFLEENKPSSRMLVEYLENYTQYAKYYQGLMNGQEQMAWIRRHLKKYKMDAKTFYPGYVFQSDNIQDNEYKPVTIKNKKVRKACAQILQN